MSACLFTVPGPKVPHSYHCVYNDIIAGLKLSASNLFRRGCFDSYEINNKITLVIFSDNNVSFSNDNHSGAAQRYDGGIHGKPRLA